MKKKLNTCKTFTLMYPVVFMGKLSCVLRSKHLDRQMSTARSVAAGNRVGSWTRSKSQTLSGSPRMKEQRKRKFPRMNQNIRKTGETGESHLVPFRKFNDSSLVGFIEVASFIFIPTPEKEREGDREREGRNNSSIRSAVFVFIG